MFLSLILLSSLIVLNSTKIDLIDTVITVNLRGHVSKNVAG